MSVQQSFVVLHSLGGSFVSARTATEALQRADVPLGFRDARGVILESMILRGRSVGAFTATLARPALPEAAR